MATLPIKTPEIDFSWLGQLPQIGEEYQQRQVRKGLADLSLGKAEDLEIAAKRLIGAGDLKLGLGLIEEATKRREAEAGSQWGRAALSVASGGQVPAPIADAIDRHSKRTGVPAELLTSNTRAESNFQPGAVSPKGAAGVSQFMPATAKQYKVNVRDPEDSIRGQADYLKDLLEKYGGNQGLAAAAYNWGPGNVDDFLSGKKTSIPNETQAHVLKVTRQPIQQWLSQYQDPMKASLFQAEQAGRASAERSRLAPAEGGQAGALLAAAPKGASKGAIEAMGTIHKEALQRQGKEQEAERKLLDEQTTEIMKRRSAADRVDATMLEMQRILDDPAFVSGAGVDTLTRWGSFVGAATDLAKRFGIPIPELDAIKNIKDTTAKNEAFRALANRLVLDITGGTLGNQISNADRTFMEVANPSLLLSKGANKEAMEIIRRLIQRDREIGQITERYRRNGGKNVSDLEKLLADHAERNRIFVARDGSLTTAGAAAKAAAEGSARSPQQPPQALPAGAPSIIYDSKGKARKVIGVEPDGTLKIEPERTPGGA